MVLSHFNKHIGASYSYEKKDIFTKVVCDIWQTWKKKKKTFESFDLSEKPGISFKIIFSESYNSGMPDALETKFDICISSYIQASQNGNSNF